MSSSPKTAILLDCEFLCVEGSLGRFWCGPQDPDPVIAQIGAVKLGLDGAFPILDTLKLYVRPVDRFGKPYALDPYFTKLTGITEADIDTKGVALSAALTDLDRFADGANFWSWGKDELMMLAISCTVAGFAAPISMQRFDNACKLLLAAGMPREDLAKTRSSGLADYYGIAHPPFSAHDALDDALSVATTLQHLLRNRQLTVSAFGHASPSQ